MRGNTATMASRSSSTSGTNRWVCIRITTRCIRAIWTIRSLRGPSSASFTIAYTTTSSRCSPRIRKNLSREAIVAEIRAQGPISFERYMELCLYHPDWGYYTSRARERFGRDGDYYTSAQLGTLFARLMARRFAAMLDELGGGDFTVIEVGSGRGDFGAELVKVSPGLRYVPIEY